MRLTYINGRFEAIASYDERLVLKEARFRWDPVAKRWWTTDLVTAGRFAAVADPAARAKLDGVRATVAASRATDAAIEVPCPEGLAFLPYQKAGVQFLLGKSASLLADEMGLGKTIQAIGLMNLDPTIRRVLIVCPATIKVNWSRELERWMTRKSTIGIGTPKLLPNTDIQIVNWDVLDRFVPQLQARQLDLIVADECFPAGTLICTQDGDRAIEQIEEGDAVLTAIGTGIVTATHRRRTFRLIKVRLCDGRSFVCTPNHLILTQHGWVGACSLSPAHRIIGHDEAVRVVWGSGEEPGESFLRQVVFGEVEDETAAVSGEALGARMAGGGVGRRNEGSPAEPGISASLLGQDEACKPNGRGSHSGAGVEAIARDESSATGSWWKRDGANPGGNGGWGDDRPVRSAELRGDATQTVGVGISDTLQNRCSGTIPQIGGGMRRGQPRPNQSAATGCEKNSAAHQVWVDCVEILKPSDRGTARSGDGGVAVYNLSVNGHPSYVIDGGFVVHNCHRAKNPKAKRSKALFAIPARRRLLLTGTPILNRPAEIWPLLNYLDPVAWPKFFTFAKRYAAARQEWIPGARKMVWNFQGASNLDELQFKLRSSLMIRRLKQDVLTELPPKIRQIIELPANGCVQVLKTERQKYDASRARVRALREAVELAKASDDPAVYHSAVDALKAGVTAHFTEMSIIRHETAVAKIPYVIEHVQGVLDEDEDRKVILFAHHVDVVQAFADAFGAQAVSLTGATKMADRQPAVDRFQTNPTCRVFIGNIQAAGVGITLTASAHVVFSELSWVPADLSQAEDRCIVEGQPILTAQGWRPIEKIQIGDMVVTQNGALGKVTDTWSRGAVIGKDHIAELDLVGWPEALFMTANHRMLLASGHWREAGMLRPGDRLAGPSVLNASQLIDLPIPDECRVPPSFVGVGGEQRNGRMVSMPASVPVDNEALFVFGYYIGDGFARIDDQAGRFVSFAGNDTTKVAALSRCQSWMTSHGVNTTAMKPDPTSHGREIRGYAAEWARWFASTFGRTTTEKRIPATLLALGKEQSMALLSGLLASDGYMRGGRHEYVTISYDLAAQVAIVMAHAGYRPLLTRQTTGCWVIAFSAEADPGYIVRSITLRHPKKSGNQRERIYDLTVDIDESFTLGTAVAHNCHRIGQKDSVLVQHLVLEGSLDATMARRLVQKQAVIDKALDTQAPAPVIELTDDDVEEAPSTKATTRKQIDAEAPTLSADAIAAIHEGLKMLAGMCDGAREIDGHGFNKFDAAIGHSLAHAVSLTPRQAALGKRLVRIYRGQLPGGLCERAGVVGQVHTPVSVSGQAS